MGHWKSGTVSIFGYGGGILLRFSEVADTFPESKEFHTLRVQPAPGNCYITDIICRLADSWKSEDQVFKHFMLKPAKSCLSVLTTKASNLSLMRSMTTVGTLVMQALVFEPQCHAWVRQDVKTHVPMSMRPSSFSE